MIFCHMGWSPYTTVIPVGDWRTQFVSSANRARTSQTEIGEEQRREESEIRPWQIARDVEELPKLITDRMFEEKEKRLSRRSQHVLSPDESLDFHVQNDDTQ